MPGTGSVTGVLVMSYGSPASREEVEPYYRDIRAGRAPSAEQLEDLLRRYDAIGGLSPLTARSTAQIARLQGALEAITPGRYRCAYGTKHATPSIEDAIGDLVDAGCSRVVGLVLAPHYSALSIGEYLERAERRARKLGVGARFVERWGEDEALIELLAGRVEDALSALGERSEAVRVIFTAHSLPESIRALGDPYPAEVEATAALIASRIGLEHYRTAWQSAPVTPRPWLSPTLNDVLEESAALGFSAVLVCPAGFTSDHLEVLYDLDIEAKARAEELGLAFSRTASLNDDPTLFAALAQRLALLDTEP